MDQITELIAEGKGKRLYATENPDEAVVYYRDETFAFHGHIVFLHGAKTESYIYKGVWSSVFVYCHT